MMRPTLLAALLLVPPTWAAELSGRILDPSGASVSGARVTLTARHGATLLTTLTGSTGAYRFASLAAGDYLLEAAAQGFGATPVEPLRLTGSHTRDLQLDLARLATQVQVTASATAQSIDEQAKALDIVSSEEIERRAEYSIAEAIRLTPGIRVQQLGGPGSLVRVLGRGMRAFDTSLLIDGFRLRDAAAPQADATAFWSDLLVVAPERVEVLRGSGASLYGTHASAAVVNVMTDQGGGRTRGEIGGEGGGLGFARGHARIAGEGGGIRYSAGLAHRNVGRGADAYDPARNWSAQASAQANPWSHGTLNARLFASESYLALNDVPWHLGSGGVARAVPGLTYTPARNDTDSRRDARYLTALASYLHEFTPAAAVRVAYSGVTTRRDSTDGPAGAFFEPLFNTFTQFAGSTHTAQARTDLSAGTVSTFTAGYEFERESYDNPSRDENPVAALRTNAGIDIRQSSHAVFAQDQLRLAGGRLQALLSGRLQSFNLERPRFTPTNELYAGMRIDSPPRAYTGDASLAYLAAARTKLRAHLGNGYRAPSLFERFAASFFGGRFSAYGNPELGPERLIAFDAGIDQYLGARARLSATYFYTRIQQAVFFDSTRSIYGGFGQYANTGGGLARGVEVSGEASPARSFAVRGSYTYTNADERRPVTSVPTLRSLRIFTHMLTLTASKSFGRSVDATFDFLAGSRYLSPIGSRILEFDGPRKADLALHYTRPLGERVSLRLYGRAENLLNQTYYEDGFLTPKAWATGGLKILF